MPRKSLVLQFFFFKFIQFWIAHDYEAIQPRVTCYKNVICFRLIKILCVFMELLPHGHTQRHAHTNTEVLYWMTWLNTDFVSSCYILRILIT